MCTGVGVNPGTIKTSKMRKIKSRTFYSPVFWKLPRQPGFNYEVMDFFRKRESCLMHSFLSACRQCREEAAESATPGVSNSRSLLHKVAAQASSHRPLPFCLPSGQAGTCLLLL